MLLAGAVIAGAVVWFGAGQSEALLVFLLSAGLGLALGGALRARWSFASTLALTTAVAVVVFCVGA